MARIFKKKESVFLIFISIIVIGGLFYHFGLFPAKASNDLIKIFPSSFIAPPVDVSGKEVPELGWQNAVAVFSQDLSASVGFKEFNQENSAYIFKENLSGAIFTVTPPAEGLAFVTPSTEEAGFVTPPTEGTGFVTSPQVGIRSILEIFGFGISDDFQENKIRNAQLRFSFAASKEAAGGELLIEYQNGSEQTWQNLGILYLGQEEISNLTNGGYFLYALPVFELWEDLESLRIRFIYQPQATSNQQQVVYLDAVWLEVEYEEIEEEITPPEIVSQKNFRLDEEPEFIFLKKGAKAKLKIHQASLRLPNGEEGVADYSFEEVDGNYRLKLNPSQLNGGRPGKYIVKIGVEKEGKIYYLEQEFTWGVLAINTNKSIYLPNETAYLQMAALDDQGHTICDANLKLEVTPPGRDQISVTVKRSGQCGSDNVTDVPDYFTYHQVGEPGTYQMKLINLDNGYEITDSFEVRDSVPFDIERIGPTRIYPPASYEMRLKIRANEDFGGQVVERLPASFEVIATSDKRQEVRSEGRLIIWDADWTAGETYELKYTFDAPDISPYLYLLGPLKIGDFSAQGGPASGWQETRQWQIASDATGIIRPDGDSSPLQWTVVPSGTHYTTIDEAITYPDTGGTTDYVHNNSTAGNVDRYNMGTIAVAETITAIDVYVYASSTKTNSSMSVDLYWDGSLQQALAVTLGTSWAWASTGVTGLSLSQSSLASLQVEITGDAGGRYYGVATLYALITYQAANQTPTLDAVVENPSSADGQGVGSTAGNPTNQGDNITWNATSTDPDGNNWYLAICKSNSVATNSLAAPSCPGGAWVVTASPIASGTKHTATTSTSGVTATSSAWWAFACDHHTNQKCSVSSQGTGSAAENSPFCTNHRPSFTGISNDSGKDPGQTVTWTSTASDTDKFAVTDWIGLYICDTTSFATGATPGCGGSAWCSATSNSNTQCGYAIPSIKQDNTYNAYAFVVDNHGFDPTGATQGSASNYVVNNVAPTVSAASISFIDAADGDTDLDLTVPEGQTTNFLIKNVLITDKNSCQNAAGGSEIATNTNGTVTKAFAYRSGVGDFSSCDEAGEANANNCYVDLADCVLGPCGGASDDTVTSTCTFSMWYVADPTDSTSYYPDNTWIAAFKAVDNNNASSSATSSSPSEMKSYTAYSLVTNVSIDYGFLSQGQTSSEGTTTIKARGNVGLDNEISGVDMDRVGGGAVIAIDQQHASTTSGFAWETGVTATTTPVQELEIDCKKTIVTGTPATSSTYWLIKIPDTQANGTYEGTNTITGVISETSTWY